MPATVRPRSRHHRAIALTMVLAAGTGAGLTACGSSGSSGSSKPSVSAIASKLSADTDFKSLNSATLTCIAGVLRQYASTASLNSYIKSGNAGDVNGTSANQAKAEAGTKACVTKYESAG